jgi:hypothetical protein
MKLSIESGCFILVSFHFTWYGSIENNVMKFTVETGLRPGVWDQLVSWHDFTDWSAKSLAPCWDLRRPLLLLGYPHSSTSISILYTSWSSRFPPLYIFLPHPSSSISHTLNQLSKAVPLVIFYKFYLNISMWDLVLNDLL